jgi:hypothetical protein
MSIQLNYTSFQELIQADIEWLIENTEKTLEREHIIQILRDYERDTISNG